jgi:hypothetical protein
LPCALLFNFWEKHELEQGQSERFQALSRARRAACAPAPCRRAPPSAVPRSVRHPRVFPMHRAVPRYTHAEETPPCHTLGHRAAVREAVRPAVCPLSPSVRSRGAPSVRWYPGPRRAPPRGLYRQPAPWPRRASPLPATQSRPPAPWLAATASCGSGRLRAQPNRPLPFPTPTNARQPPSPLHRAPSPAHGSRGGRSSLPAAEHHRRPRFRPDQAPKPILEHP